MTAAASAPVEVDTDPTRLDLDLVCDFIAASYWGHGRSREHIEASLRHSLCFGLYREGEQLGFARVVTDRTTFAYLADVFIIESARLQGLGVTLIRHVVEAPELADVKHWTLFTRDAHGLYARFGFAALDDPEGRFMYRRGGAA